MPNAALSNRERRELKRKMPAKPRVVAPVGVVVKAVKQADKKPAEPVERDGFIFLSRKRLAPKQVKAGLYYRDLFRVVATWSGADVGDSVERLMTSGGSVSSDVRLGSTFTATATRAELFRLRWVVLGGEADVLTALDGVCGMGHTLLFLAGGKRQREEQLMQSLKIGLNLLAAHLDRATQKTA